MTAHVRGMTTDFGVEMHSSALPDIAKAFIAWQGGAKLVVCSRLVRTDRRLCWRCMRVSVWCHAWGGIMKAMAHVLFWMASGA